MLFLFEILFDCGLFILIWMVQLIVYPSFVYFEPKNLIRWHQKYTGAIAIIVVPLMFGQLGISIYQAYDVTSLMSILKLILVLFIWVFTFAYFAPVHGKISRGNSSEKMLFQLIRLNWWRTMAWTFIFLLTLCRVKIAQL